MRNNPKCSEVASAALMLKEFTHDIRSKDVYELHLLWFLLINIQFYLCQEQTNKTNRWAWREENCHTVSEFRLRAVCESQEVRGTAVPSPNVLPLANEWFWTENNWDQRHRKESSWIFSYLTKSRSFWEMRTVTKPLTRGVYGWEDRRAGWSCICRN